MAPQPPYNTTGGYGGNASLTTQPSGLTAFLDDALDGFPALIPQLNAGGGLSPIVLDPSTISAASGLPEINAILVELRLISALLHHQLGATQLDLQQMRADEAWSSNPATGVL